MLGTAAAAPLAVEVADGMEATLSCLALASELCRECRTAPAEGALPWEQQYNMGYPLSTLSVSEGGATSPLDKKVGNARQECFLAGVMVQLRLTIEACAGMV